MLRKAGNQWGMLALIISMALLVSCATTPRGKAQQAGRVMIALDEIMLQECQKSKANAALDATTGEMEWQPLARNVCENAHVAYKLAFASWEATLDELSQDPNASIGTHLTVITRYILIVADILKDAGIQLPDSIMGHVDNIKGVLLR